MRRSIVFAMLMLTAQAVSALTLEELEAARQAAAQRAAAAAGIDLSGGPAGPGGATGQYDGCIGSAPGGMSLLGVQSDMPSTQGVTPAAKLGRDHPAMKALIELGTQMGLYRNAEGASAEDIARNDAASQRKAEHDFYEDMLTLLNWGNDEANRITEAAGFEKYARAHKEYQALARQYAELHLVAEEAGRACP